MNCFKDLICMASVLFQKSQLHFGWDSSRAAMDVSPSVANFSEACEKIEHRRQTLLD